MWVTACRARAVLARLDDQDQRNALRTAEADLAAAKAGQVQASNEEARKRGLLANGNSTQALYDTALLAKRTADARVVAAQAACRRRATGSATPSCRRTGTAS